MIEKTITSTGKDSSTSRLNLFSAVSKQQFVKHDVLISQGIDHSAGIFEAGKILAAGGCLFVEEQKRRNQKHS